METFIFTMTTVLSQIPIPLLHPLLNILPFKCYLLFVFLSLHKILYEILADQMAHALKYDLVSSFQ